MTGTLTVNTTGGFMRFSGLTADIGLASDTDMINLSSVGVTIDNNLTVTGSLSADHDTLLGLADDDHTQYLNTARHDTTDRHGAASVDHGLIDGLGDDDHPIYFPLTGTRSISGDILPATSDTYDIGKSDQVWDNIWCKTLHTSAGSINLGSIELTDIAGELAVDATPVPSLTTTQEASANALSQANAYTDTQVGGSGINKGYDTGSTSSGTTLDFTGISEDAVQINVSYRNHSNNNASYAPIAQLSNQSSVQATGYDGHIMTGGSNDRSDTDGIHFCNRTTDHAAGDIYDGHFIITRMNEAGTIWAWQGTSIADAESGFRNTTGYVVLTTAFGGTLRITSEAGGATFDGGTFYASWF
jgi:hypothetical protein